MPNTIFPTTRGTYALFMRLDHAVTAQVGQLGRVDFEPGNYVYIGSARGPGGLRARLNRHIRAEKPLHWHIDYLTIHAHIVAIWMDVSDRRLECEWARTLAALPGVRAPVAGFGSSDCACAAHLFRLSSDAEAHVALGKPAIVTT